MGKAKGLKKLTSKTLRHLKNKKNLKAAVDPTYQGGFKTTRNKKLKKAVAEDMRAIKGFGKAFLKGNR